LQETLTAPEIKTNVSTDAKKSSAWYFCNGTERRKVEEINFRTCVIVRIDSALTAYFSNID
jgi:hypothetical protein